MRARQQRDTTLAATTTRRKWSDINFLAHFLHNNDSILHQKKISNKQKLKNDSITTSFGCLFSFCLSCIVQSLSASPPAGDFLTAHTSHNRGTNNYIRPPVSSPPPIYQPINKTFSPPQQRRRLLLVVVAGRGHGCRICIYRAASIKTHNVKRHNRCIAIDPPNKPKPTTTHVHSAR